MRTIEWTSAFKRDFNRIASAPRHRDIDEILSAVLDLLTDNQPLPTKHRDHALGGNWKGHRECHLKPDLLLIYKFPDDRTLRLTRMGTHSDLLGR